MGIFSPGITEVPYTGETRPEVYAGYITTIWLTWRFGLPLGPFSGIPLFIFFTLYMYFKVPGHIQKLAIKFALLLFAYELLKFIQPGFYPTLKGVFGIIAMSLIMTTSAYALKVISLQPDKWIGKWLRVTLYLIFSAIIAELAINVIIPILPDYPYVSYLFGTRAFAGFFQEPSHLALAISPFIFLIFYNISLFKKYLGKPALYIVILTTLLVTCSTVMAIWIAAMGVAFILYLRKGKVLSIIAMGIMMFLILAIALTVPEIYERISSVLSASAGINAIYSTASMSHTESSALALLKGFDMMRHATQHFPLGVAFLNMRDMAPYSTLSYMSPFMYEFNSDDGTSILFKGICEMGLLFEIFVVASLWLFLKRLIKCRKPEFWDAVTLAFIFSFFCNFLRGTSYYHGTVGFGIALLVFHFYKPFRVRNVASSARNKNVPAITHVTDKNSDA